MYHHALTQYGSPEPTDGAGLSTRLQATGPAGQCRRSRQLSSYAASALSWMRTARSYLWQSPSGDAWESEWRAQHPTSWSVWCSSTPQPASREAWGESQRWLRQRSCCPSSQNDCIRHAASLQHMAHKLAHTQNLGPAHACLHQCVGLKISEISQAPLQVCKLHPHHLSCTQPGACHCMQARQPWPPTSAPCCRWPKRC